MTAKVEGTVILDGLIQGKISNLPGAEQRLRDWEQFTKSTKLIFNLEIAGGTFGFLADQTPIAVAHLGHDPAETIESAIGELLKTFAPAERASVFSTLRSVEYRKGEEVQTLYVIAPNGTVLARGRTVSAQTAAPPPQLTLRDRALHITVGALLLVLLLMASSFFIDYHRMFASIRSQLRPLDAAHFPIDSTDFQRYFTIESKSAASDGQGLSLTLRRTPAFADPLAIPTSRPTPRPASLPSTQNSIAPSPLAAAAIATGYVRCEFFDENAQFMGYVFLRIKPLRDSETMTLQIPFETDRRPSSVTLTY